MDPTSNPNPTSKISLNSCLGLIGAAGILVLILFYINSCQNTRANQSYKDIGETVAEIIDAQNPKAVAESPDDCSTTQNLTGKWLTEYSCTQNGAASFSGSEMVRVAQSGTAVNFHVIDDPTSYSGTLCDHTMNWQGGNANYSETGTWKVIDQNHFTKNSSYVRTQRAGGGNGTCTGTGVRQ